MSDNKDFTQADGHGYILDRNHIAACRLNLQHYLWREALEFTVNPTVHIPKEAVVADVACGTGLWLLDVAKAHPDTQLHGFDLDLAQAPHAAWLPPNIQLHKWNLFDNIPAEFESKFDFVHVRLVVLVLTGENTQSFVKKLMQLLKPGGYLQWDELDCVNMRVRKVNPAIASPALDEIHSLCYSGGRHDWTLTIPEMLAEEEFTNTSMTKFGDKPGLARAFNDQHMLTMEEFAAGMIRVGKHDVANKAFDLIGKAHGESVRGATLCIPRIVVVAHKPL
ncbi:UMTA methyltransferase family protein [Lophiotrema nucula]|uniref:UMTA methyltransferase family protein n=1 Tax=Lophiotrema nucula TaxID=690887 RepID=A0A6A5Z4M0_9PLEO|nr:UMTA methyltransferase family protein [Lophiotrema nucula]